MSHISSTKFQNTDLEQIVCFTSFQLIVYEDGHSFTLQKAVLTRKIQTDEMKNKFA